MLQWLAQLKAKVRIFEMRQANKLDLYRYFIESGCGTGTLQYFAIFDGNLFEYFSCLIFCFLDSDLNLDPNRARPGSGSALYRHGSGNVGMRIQNTG